MQKPYEELRRKQEELRMERAVPARELPAIRRPGGKTRPIGEKGHLRSLFGQAVELFMIWEDKCRIPEKKSEINLAAHGLEGVKKNCGLIILTSDDNLRIDKKTQRQTAVADRQENKLISYLQTGFTEFNAPFYSIFPDLKTLRRENDGFRQFLPAFLMREAEMNKDKPVPNEKVAAFILR